MFTLQQVSRASGTEKRAAEKRRSPNFGWSPGQALITGQVVRAESELPLPPPTLSPFPRARARRREWLVFEITGSLCWFGFKGVHPYNLLYIYKYTYTCSRSA